MSRWIRGSGVSLLVAALAGCAAVGPNFQRPAAADAKGYAMAGDSVPALAVLTPSTRAAGPWWRGTRQAAMVAYVDDFRVMMLITLGVMPLLLLMRTPKYASEAPHVAVD